MIETSGQDVKEIELGIRNGIVYFNCTKALNKMSVSLCRFMLIFLLSFRKLIAVQYHFTLACRRACPHITTTLKLMIAFWSNDRLMQPKGRELMGSWLVVLLTISISCEFFGLISYRSIINGYLLT